MDEVVNFLRLVAVCLLIYWTGKITNDLLFGLVGAIFRKFFRLP